MILKALDKNIEDILEAKNDDKLSGEQQDSIVQYLQALATLRISYVMEKKDDNRN